MEKPGVSYKTNHILKSISLIVNALEFKKLVLFFSLLAQNSIFKDMLISVTHLSVCLIY
jgi:hypothetical protein